MMTTFNNGFNKYFHSLKVIKQDIWYNLVVFQTPTKQKLQQLKCCGETFDTLLICSCCVQIFKDFVVCYTASLYV